MEPRLIAALILAPFALAFLYSAIHELVRYRSEGRAEYGLSYDEETGTTHVTAIGEETEAYDLDDFDPGDYRDPEIRTDPDEERS
ncbi:hypothetical protein PGB28_00565 [Primorskyibacter aestuariivivens]|uniref:hypothetical protein n=1 Tax=Primorskyibacter aestuariivivens TaxID=1888912 RepID=UPI0023006F52|nr:hypothetical protein [Primorskyibacter aestuariivivens]MDA7426930.1 hypothetical protein [Primorskyibacter aestuariivivens]